MMLIVSLTGNHNAMGYQHGQKLIRYRRSLLGLIEEYHETVRRFPREMVDKNIREVHDLLQERSPQTLDMLRGIADGFEVSQADLLGLRLRGYLEDRLASFSASPEQDTGCTAWASSNPQSDGDRIFIAKNRDYLISNQALQAIFRCHPQKGLEYFSFNSVGSCNTASAGMNEGGLAIVDTRVPSTDIGPGLPRFVLMMHILEQFRSVHEVIDFLRSVPHMGGGSLVFADAAGRIGKAEIGAQNLEISCTDSGHLVSTNHFEGTSTKPSYRRRSEEKERHSKWRFETATQEIGKAGGNIDLHFAMGLMSTHGDPFSICNHGSPNPAEKTATISSVIFVPERRGFTYCQGFPCQSPFHWVSF